MAMDIKSLRRLALTDFSDRRYRGMSLIEIYVSDKKGYKRLQSEGKITWELSKFISKRGTDIEKASTVSLDAMRKLHYEQIFDEYFALQKQKSENPVFESDLQIPEEQAKRMILLQCPVHDQELKKLGVKEVLNKNREKKSFPMYWCKSCDKLYTYLPDVAGGKTFRLDGLRYTNVAIQKTMGVVLEKSNKEITSKNSVQKKVNCIVYGSIKPAVCGINECKNTKLVKSAIQLLSKKHKKFNLI